MKKLIYLLMAVSLVFTACKKEVEEGCTDASAINFNPNAEENDGSCLYKCNDPYAINYDITSPDPGCRYEGDVVFYLSEDMAEHLTNGVSPSIDWLDLYVDGVLEGTMPGDTWFYYGEVTCYDTPNAPIYLTYSWWDELATNMSWKLRDDNGYPWVDATNQVLANGCLELFIDYGDGNIMIKPNQESH